jgi:hypothetical protein
MQVRQQWHTEKRGTTMATRNSEMAYDDSYPDNSQPAKRPERETSIHAHIVRSIAVTMSMAEMDTLSMSLGKSRDELTPGELAVQAEFLSAVEEARF